VVQDPREAAMDFTEVMFSRRSVRGYKSQPIPPEVLENVLDSLRVSPSAANLQPRSFIVIQDEATKLKLREAYDREWMSQAPVLIAACVEPAKAWKRADGFNAADLDIAIALDHLTLAAANEGLGTCWICNFDEPKAKAILGVPDDIRLVALMPMGYPDPAPATPLRPFVRKSLADIVRYDKW
jgi:nitroreductase